MSELTTSTDCTKFPRGSERYIGGGEERREEEGRKERGERRGWKEKDCTVEDEEGEAERKEGERSRRGIYQQRGLQRGRKFCLPSRDSSK
jgi:hypothetical protein